MELFYLIISVIATLITTLVPAGIALYKTIASRDSVKANADILSAAKRFIAEAEAAYDGFDKLLKAQGGSAGTMKKSNVFNNLQAFALQNGYEFNAEEWSARIDELVAYTKNVNAKK